MQLPSIPELVVLAVQAAVFILLVFALAGLVVKEYYRLKGRWLKEHHHQHNAPDHRGR